MSDDDDVTPEAAAIQRQQEMEQMEAAFRGLADTVVTLRRTLVDGGFPEDAANAMALRAWMTFFPGQQPPSPLGFLFGGPPS
jgi:hypothetical protein